MFFVWNFATKSKSTISWVLTFANGKKIAKSRKFLPAKVSTFKVSVAVIFYYILFVTSFLFWKKISRIVHRFYIGMCLLFCSCNMSPRIIYSIKVPLLPVSIYENLPFLVVVFLSLVCPSLCLSQKNVFLIMAFSNLNY